MPNDDYEKRICPAMEVVFDGDCDYRCERDLHHHLTLLFNASSNMKLGQRDRAIVYGHPTGGRYQWTGVSETSGNLDMCLAPAGDQTAIEINYNYNNEDKIKQGIIKLLDPENPHRAAVYLVVSTRPIKSAIERSFQSALKWISDTRQRNSSFGLKVIVIEQCGGCRFLFEGTWDGHPPSIGNEVTVHGRF